MAEPWLTALPGKIPIRLAEAACSYAEKAVARRMRLLEIASKGCTNLIPILWWRLLDEVAEADEAAVERAVHAPSTDHASASESATAGGPRGKPLRYKRASRLVVAHPLVPGPKPGRGAPESVSGWNGPGAAPQTLALRLVLARGRAENERAARPGPRLLFAWALQLTRALLQLHSVGVAHGNLIPGAVFVHDGAYAQSDRSWNHVDDDIEQEGVVQGRRVRRDPRPQVPVEDQPEVGWTVCVAKLPVIPADLVAPPTDGAAAGADALMPDGADATVGMRSRRRRRAKDRLVKKLRSRDQGTPDGAKAVLAVPSVTSADALYLSPERAEAIGAASQDALPTPEDDIYALGVILLELATLSHPFSHDKSTYGLLPDDREDCGLAPVVEHGGKPRPQSALREPKKSLPRALDDPKQSIQEAKAARGLLSEHRKVHRRLLLSRIARMIPRRHTPLMLPLLIRLLSPNRRERPSAREALTFLLSCKQRSTGGKGDMSLLRPVIGFEAAGKAVRIAARESTVARKMRPNGHRRSSTGPATSGTVAS